MQEETVQNRLSGLVLRCVSGFYYVAVEEAVYTCRARGSFRRQGLTPMAGDRVEISVRSDGEGTVEAVCPRRNCLVRPPVANVDLLVMVASVREPETNTLVLDKMLAIAEKQGICPIVVVSKTDLADPSELESVYRLAGIECFCVSVKKPETLEPLRRRLSGYVSVFSGNSGVGKSSILNALDPSLVLEIGDISRKLGRGRHTTRTASLYRLADGYLVDTPGFSSLDLLQVESVRKEELADCFREFGVYFGKCRFAGCAHYKEPGCAVRQAVEQGKIAPSRYESYVAMYEAVKDLKEWETP